MEQLCPPSEQTASDLRAQTAVIGLSVFDRDGTTLGVVRNVFVDDQTGEAWLMVTCWSRLHTRRSACRVALSSLSYDPALRGFRSRTSARAFFTVPVQFGDDAIWRDGYRAREPELRWPEPLHPGV